MCGIAGIYGNVDPGLRTKALNTMSQLLSHRGPDGRGFYEESDIGLAHTRLSIIDLSASGNQPLFNEDRSLVLICNGEIYNYKELRKGLTQKGHHFSSASDSEVILHLYEEHHNDFAGMLHQLTGMFAFALWDVGKKKLFIARDRMGIKPLYYTQFADKLLFASEVKAIADIDLIDVNIDETSLYEYFLLGSIPGPNTLYTNIKALEPGHYIEAGERILIKQYWDIPAVINKFKNEDEVLEEAEKLLSRVVKDHLIADVPVGTFLSSGVDSSLITALAAGHNAHIYSFTASFPGEPEDESEIALATAQELGITHQSYKLTGNFFSGFDSQFLHMDQPFAISSALSLGRISSLAKNNIKVVLTGDGADELWGGYYRHDPYWLPPFLRSVPGWLRKGLISVVANITGRKAFRELNNNLAKSDGKKYLERVRVLPENLVASLFSSDSVKNIDKSRYLNRLDKFFSTWNGEDELNRMLYVDCKTSLVDEMLTKCDRMTMRHGVEGRVPFLDHRFVELSFSIPGHLKRENNVGKLLLRKILAKKLNASLAYREKQGFNAPLGQWLKHDRETVLYTQTMLKDVPALPCFNQKTLQQLAANIDEANHNLIFYIVCLNFFLKNENISSGAYLPR